MSTPSCLPGLLSFPLGPLSFPLGLLSCLVVTPMLLSSAPGAQPADRSEKTKQPPAAAAQPAAKAKAQSAVRAPDNAANVTTITAKKRLLLDAKGYEATFLGEVKVVDPRFSLNCEKLVAYLKRPGTEIKPGAAPGPASPVESVPGAGAEKTSGGGVEKAVAEGDVIIVQDKLNDKGEIERSIGRAQKAVYDASSGNISLSGWPQVEQKQNTIVAMEESTVIILNSKGSLDVVGHSKSVLRNTGTDNVR